MIVTSSTFWSRVKRAKLPVLICEVDSLDMVESIIWTAEKYKQPVILSFTAKRTLGNLEVLILASYRLAERSSELCLLQGSVTSLEEAKEYAHLPLQIIAMEKSNASTQITHYLRTSGSSALAIGYKVRATANHMETVDTLRALDADVLMLTHNAEAVASPSLAFIDDVVKKGRIPTVVEFDSLAPKHVRQLAKTGVAGWYLTDYVAQAYTAGLRTGLRDRSRFLPIEYLSLADTAVRHSIEQLIQLIRS